MAFEFQKRWKEIKKSLSEAKVKMPKRPGFKRLEDYFAKSTTISEHFDLLDIALEKKSYEKAQDHFSAMKPKLDQFLKAGLELKEEYLKQKDDKSILVDKALKSVQGLIMMARADLVTLKDQFLGGDRGVDAKKLNDWKEKLRAMVRLSNDQVFNPLGSVIVAGRGLAERFDQLALALTKHIKEANVDEINKVVKEADIQMSKLVQSINNSKKLEGLYNDLYPALKKYFERNEMKKLDSTDEYQEAKRSVTDGPQSLNDSRDALRLAKDASVKFFNLKQKLMK